MADRSHMTLVIVPAWNEEDAIGAVVTELLAELDDTDVLVVDDGSTDRTAERARAAGARVASLPLHEGVGAVSQAGYRYAARHGYRVVAHCDGDGQHTATSVKLLVEAVDAGECAMAIGSRFLERVEGQHRPTLARRFGIALFRRYVSMASRQRVTDPTSGLRASNRDVVAEFVRLYPSDHPELETYARIARLGYRVREYPVLMRDRAAGQSKITPLKSVFFVFHTLLAVGAAALHMPRRKAAR